MIITTILMMSCEHIDVNTAFLYATLESPVYMVGPPGYPCKPGQCLKITKALYGCRTAPREWYQLLCDFILTLGFVTSLLDPCLFFQTVCSDLVIIYIYVDDILLF